MRLSRALAALLTFLVASVTTAADGTLSAPRLEDSAPAGFAQVAPLGDGAVAVWWADNELRSIRLDASGRPRDARSLRIAVTGRLDALHLISNASQPFVAWTGQDGTYVAPMHEDGRLGTPFRLHKWGLLAAGVAVSSDRVVMVTPVANQALVTIASLDGTVLASDVTIGVTPPNTAMPGGDVAAVGESFLFSWVNTGDGRIHAVQLTGGQVAARSFTPAGDLLQLPGRQGKNVRVATNGNGSMLVFQDYDEAIGRYVLRVRALSPSGNALGTPLNVLELAGRSTATVPAIAPSGSGYVIASLEPSGPNSVLTVLNVDPSGTIQQKRTLVLDETFSTWAIDVVSTPSAALITIRNSALVAPGQAYVIKAGHDGGVLEEPQLISSPAEFPRQEAAAIVSTAAGWLAAWREDGAVSRAVVGRLDRNGSPLDGAGLKLMAEGGNQQSVAAAWSGSKMLVAWKADTSFYGAIVNPTDWPPRSPFRIGSGSGSTISVAWDGSEFVAVWRLSASSIGATRIGRDGGLLDSTPVAITPAEAPDVVGTLDPSLAWNGSEFLMVFGRQAKEPPPGGEGKVFGLAAQRVSRNLILQGQPIEISPLAFGPYAPALFPQAVASGSSWLVTWVQNNQLRGFRVSSEGTRSDSFQGAYSAVAAPRVAALAGGWLVAGGSSVAQVPRSGVVTPFQPIVPAGSQLDAVTVAGSRMALVYSLDGTAYVRFTDGRPRAAGH
jgi:hypothetical protein